MSEQQATTIEGTSREDLLNAITTDTTREPFERETRLMWNADTDRVDVHTAERAVMRRFLSHPEFELQWFEVRSGDRGSRTVYVEKMPKEWNGEDVLSINGSLPIGCVSVKSTPRSADGHARVVSQRVLKANGEGE